MADLAPQQVSLDGALWSIVLPPLLAAVAAFVVALREERAPRGDMRWPQRAEVSPA